MRFLGLVALVGGLIAFQPATAQGISQKVAVCNPSFTNRCIAPDVNGAVPITGTLTPGGTQDINIKQVGGNAVTTTVPVSDGGGSLTVDTLQLPATLGIKTSAASLSVAPSSDGVWPVSQSGSWTVAATQSGAWNITNVTGTVSLPTGAATAANQTSPLAPVTAGAATATTSMLTGCRYLTTLDTFANTNQGAVNCDSRGNLRVQIGGNAVTDSDGRANTTVYPWDITNGSTGFLGVGGHLFNGTNWDRERSAVNAADSTGTGLNTAALMAQLDDTSPSTVTENNFGNLRMTQNRALLVRPFATASQDWTYAAASGGISNTTTAVTLVGATASVRNYLTACQISADALGAATEVVIRDGAAGTVLQRIKLTTAGLSSVSMSFPTPLKSTANTLLEAATLTATITGGVYINCQGFTAP